MTTTLHPRVTPSYHNLFRPTLHCSAILPSRTLAVLLPQPTLDCSSFLPHPTTTFFVLHCSPALTLERERERERERVSGTDLPSYEVVKHLTSCLVWLGRGCTNDCCLRNLTTCLRGLGSSPLTLTRLRLSRAC